MRIVFAGSPAAAVPSLLALLDSEHDVVAVVTRQDSLQGRRRVLTPTPVAAVAEERGLPVIRTNRLDAEATQSIASFEADLGVIVAFGGLVREPLLSQPQHGWINLHFSLLPRWRGASPVQRALMAGDEVTGASVFQLVEELDAGDLFGHLTQLIGANENAGHLLSSLADGGAALLVQVVDAIADGTARAEPQHGDVTFAPKLTLDDGRVDFAQPASAVLAVIRGVTPEPGAFALLGDTRLKILEVVPARDVDTLAQGTLAMVDGNVLVGTSTHPVHVLSVQPAGKKPMSATDWWRGRPEGAPVTFGGAS